MKSLLDQIIDLYGEKIEVVQSGSTPGDQLGITANISKLVEEANFKPKRNIRSNLSKMLKWAINEQ